MQFTRMANEGLYRLVGKSIESLLGDYYNLLKVHFGIADAHNRPGEFADSGVHQIEQNAEDERVHGLRIRVNDVILGGAFNEDAIRAFAKAMFVAALNRTVVGLNIGGHANRFVDICVVVVTDRALSDGSSIVKHGAIIEMDMDLSKLVS